MRKSDIGFGIFCFGEDYYYKGAYEKIQHIMDEGFPCSVLTENPKYFKGISNFLEIIPYYRSYKSYYDKMILPKYILKDFPICVLIDADTHITDYSFLNNLPSFDFKDGISYVDILRNHPSRLRQIKDINMSQTEWMEYHNYAKSLYPDFGDFEVIWEYFLVINRDGFKEEDFYYFYEKLQVAKEFSELTMKKDVNGSGEGLSIQIASKLSGTTIQRDMDLFNLIKNSMSSVSRRFTHPDFLPDYMK
jgi:hypothetical protein